LLRKQSGTAAIPGLFLETLFLLPLALVYLVILANRGALTFGPLHLALSAILTTSGIVTAVPLIWFGYAARHLRLVTIGFLQYLSPSISFILGLFVYHETFTVSISSPSFSFGLRLSLFQPKRFCAGARRNGWRPKHRQICH